MEEKIAMIQKLCTWKIPIPFFKEKCVRYSNIFRELNSQHTCFGLFLFPTRNMLRLYTSLLFAISTEMISNKFPCTQSLETAKTRSLSSVHYTCIRQHYSQLNITCQTLATPLSYLNGVCISPDQYKVSF